MQQFTPQVHPLGSALPRTSSSRGPFADHAAAGLPGHRLARVRRRLMAVLIGALLTLHAIASDSGAARAESGTVLVVLSDQSTPYQEVTAGLRERLRGTASAGLRVVTASWEEFPRQSSSLRPAAVIVVGVKAMQTVMQARPTVPVVCGLIPQRAYEALAGRGAAREPQALWTAVYLDQPAARQFDLMRLVLPGRLRIGVLLGSESEAQLDHLHTLARERRLILNTQVVGSANELAAALQKAAENSDAIWMLPDNAVSSANSVRDLLLASYRHKRPVIGFSQGYVRAGALAAVYSTPSQIGGELAGLLVQVLANPARMPAPRAPAEYEVALNYHVARAYGLQLDDEQSVLKKLRALERLP